MNQVIDLAISYKFLKNLVTPFEKWPAYALGIIDKDGNILKPRRERLKQEEKDALGYFDVVTLNLKKLLGKLPGGKSAIASYAAAYLLLKEYPKKNVKEGFEPSEQQVAFMLQEAIKEIEEGQDIKNVEEEKKPKTAKALIYQTDVYGAKGYYGQCKESGCDHKTRTYDRISQAQNAIKKHHQEHFNNIEEGQDLIISPITKARAKADKLNYRETNKKETPNTKGFLNFVNQNIKKVEEEMPTNNTGGVAGLTPDSIGVKKKAMIRYKKANQELAPSRVGKRFINFVNEDTDNG